MNKLDKTPYGHNDTTNEVTTEGDPIAYQRPQLTAFGPLQQVIRGASLKGVDSSGELDLENR